MLLAVIKLFFFVLIRNNFIDALFLFITIDSNFFSSKGFELLSKRL